MRTTIRLPDPLLAQAKKRASQDGITLGDLVASAVRERVLRPSRAAAGQAFRLVTFGEKGLAPGMSWAELKQEADQEDSACLRFAAAARTADGK
jgi:Arc/MetJ family transcription regulator